VRLEYALCKYIIRGCGHHARSFAMHVISICRNFRSIPVKLERRHHNTCITYRALPYLLLLLPISHLVYKQIHPSQPIEFLATQLLLDVHRMAVSFPPLRSHSFAPMGLLSGNARSAKNIRDWWTLPPVSLALQSQSRDLELLPMYTRARPSHEPKDTRAWNKSIVY
jgi:hypothetical protein